MKTGIELIAQERQEQIEKHGFSIDHDKQYTADELRWAAVYCLTGLKHHWPIGWSDEWRKKIGTKSYSERVAISGAFAAAEIDRLQAQQTKSEGE